jgi:CHAT domain-containing protein
MGIRAGIPTVLGTLWFAADLETADFVLNFYRAWEGGTSREQALRESQVTWIHQKEYPANWSNFVLLQN